ncbi:MAG: hypothetical protein NVS4B6_08880 [Mycobacterium sp.]
MAISVLLVACQFNPPDRRADVQRLTQQIRAMVGVQAVTQDVADNLAQGLVYLRVNVDVADDITAEQLVAITSRYLHNLRTVDYSGYDAELDARRAWNVFTVDSGRLPVTNEDQILAQARDWVALRNQFRGATTDLRATITHPGAQMPVQEWGHSNRARIQLPDTTDYTNVAAAVRTVAATNPQLSSLDWTFSAGKQHPADIKTSRRFPTRQEIQVFNRLNADQAIAHLDRLRINRPHTTGVWLAEKTTQSHDPSVAAQLAQQHLPIVATLPAPVLYTASDQISGHLGNRGQVTGPLAITIGGCTTRDWPNKQPTPAEQALSNTYEHCRR